MGRLGRIRFRFDDRTQPIFVLFFSEGREQTTKVLDEKNNNVNFLLLPMASSPPLLRLDARLTPFSLSTVLRRFQV